MDAHEFAQEWIKSWNSHDLDAILSHYADDLEITTPMIKLALGTDKSSLKGKELVADYWRKALQKLPDLTFELIDVTTGVNSVALYYKSVLNKKSIEVMFFNEQGKVNSVFAHQDFRLDPCHGSFSIIRNRGTGLSESPAHYTD